MDNIFAVTALIINEDGKILAVSRKNDPNDFGLIGGKIDQGESPESACIRETKEETGINIIKIEPIFDRHGFALDDGKICRCFFVVAYSGEISTKETGKVEWVAPEILTKGTFGSYNTSLLDKCANILSRISVKVKIDELIGD